MSETYEISVAASIDNIELVKLIKKYHENLFNSDLIASIESPKDYSKLEIDNSHIYIVAKGVVFFEYIFDYIELNIEEHVLSLIYYLIEYYDFNQSIISDYLENKDQILKSLKTYKHEESIIDNTETIECSFGEFLEEYEKEIKEHIPDVGLDVCSSATTTKHVYDKEDYRIYPYYYEGTISWSLVEGEMIYSF
jgi:hypothetical protein